MKAGEATSQPGSGDRDERERAEPAERAKGTGALTGATKADIMAWRKRSGLCEKWPLGRKTRQIGSSLSHLIYPMCF